MSVLIDASQCTLTGNLTLSGGLAALYDGNAGTYAHIEQTTGWAGLDFSTPRRIDRVELVAAGNGFDASGSTGTITIRLYGKKDGVSHLLGTWSQNDPNAAITVTINSADKFTMFDGIYFDLQTPVWCLVCEARFYEADEALVTKPYYSKVIETPVEIHVGYTPMHDLFQVIQIIGPTRLSIASKVSLKLEGYSYGIGYGMSFALRGPSETYSGVAVPVSLGDTPPAFIEGGLDGGNIEPPALHYARTVVMTSVELSQPGFYRIEPYMNVHGSSADPNVGNLTINDSLAKVLVEGAQPHNFTTYRLEPLD